MPATPPQDLLTEGKCFDCYGASLIQTIELALLDRFAIASGGVGTCLTIDGTGSPVGVITPTCENQFYRETTGPGLWQATGPTSADWILWAGNDPTPSPCNNWNGLDWISDVIIPDPAPPDYVMTSSKLLNTFTFHYHDTGNNNSGGNRFSAFMPSFGPDPGCAYAVNVESTVTPAFVATGIVDRGITVELFEADKTTHVDYLIFFQAVQRINGTQNFPFTIPASGIVPGRWFNLVLSWDCRHTPSEPITWDAVVTVTTTPV